MSKVSLNIAPRILQSVSSIYNDPYRVIMEMVDNSIDDVESPAFYDTLLTRSDAYSQKVIIEIEISGNSYKDGKITITDNCRGIPDLGTIVRNIGNSGKRTSVFTNGQFGFGLFSFMAVCGRLEILSKNENNSHPEYVMIKASDFEQDDLSRVKFEVIESSTSFPHPSGTRVTLSEFKPYFWKEIRAEKLKDEIEKHFELILNRKNIEISVIQQP